jgi:hypothetical protein
VPAGTYVRAGAPGRRAGGASRLPLPDRRDGGSQPAGPAKRPGIDRRVRTVRSAGKIMDCLTPNAVAAIDPRRSRRWRQDLRAWRLAAGGWRVGECRVPRYRTDVRLESKRRTMGELAHTSVPSPSAGRRFHQGEIDAPPLTRHLGRSVGRRRKSCAMADQPHRIHSAGQFRSWSAVAMASQTDAEIVSEE